MTRLADYIKPDPVLEPSVPGGDAVVEVYDFPDQQQPTVKETVKRMVREVVVPDNTPDYESAEELERMYAAAEAGWAPNEIVPKSRRMSEAFDSGAKLNMPQPKDEPTDPALKRPAKRKTPGGRPPASDEFTDLFAAGMITLIAFTLGSDFQPTAQEAQDLARPLGNILARRIDLAKKLGQDANDVVAFAIALMAYTVRVGPVATEKVRDAYRDRQERARVHAIAEPPNRGGADGMVAGQDVGGGAGGVQAHNPFDALAKARNTQHRVLDRDLGVSANGNLPMASNG